MVGFLLRKIIFKMIGEDIMGNKEQFTMEQVNESRHRGHKVYGIKKGYCDLHSSCDDCDKRVRAGCILITGIEEIQKKRIMKICK